MKPTVLPVVSRTLSAVAACALLGATAIAQAPATPAPGPAGIPATAGTATPAPKPKALAAGDATYLKNSLKSLSYMIQLNTAAKSVGDLNYVRLRDTTTKDMTTVLQALTKIAEPHGEKAPTEVTGTDKVDLDRVTKAKPDKLVKEWVDALAKESKHLDHETEMLGKTSQDPDMKTFVTNYGPTIRSIFSSAESSDKTLNKKK
jgi:hypothetical protein